MTVNITWANRPNYQDGGVPAVFLGTAEELTESGSVVRTAAAPTAVELVRVAVGTNAIRIAIGVGDPAVTASTGSLLPAGQVEYFRVEETQKVAVIISS